MSMSSEWYLMSEGVVKGPLSAPQLRAMAQAGQIGQEDRIRKGDGPWAPANRVKGLFDDAFASTSGEPELSGFHAGDSKMPNGGSSSRGLPGVRSIKQCISRDEKKKRGSAVLISLLFWIMLGIFTLSTFGFVLVLWLISWVIRKIAAEYHVRKLQAIGTAATPDQFPEIAQALTDICTQFQVDHQPKVILLNSREFNAFAVTFARKKVIVLLSEILDEMIERPAELRFILGHELAHLVLDDSWGGKFLIYRPAAFKAARELTCDNAGCAAAGDLESAKTALKRVGVGNKLYPRLNEQFLETEAKYIYSGITGWFLKQYLTYPPLGRRVSNVASFHQAHANSSVQRV
jgi:Zn-dependent protease with chaperone function